MLTFRIIVPGITTYTGIFSSQRAAAADAERRYPSAPPASTVCMSTLRGLHP